jgi:hypothetical protein
MLNDPMVDWLKQRNPSEDFASQTDPFRDFLMTRGCEFETEVIELIKKKIPVVFGAKRITPETVARTLSLMAEGVPAIHSAPVMNYDNHTRGIIDLLVRSDYLDAFINVPPLSDDEVQIGIFPEGALTPYHYVVIDIKFSTLHLRADGIHLLNSGSFPAYKAQCLIYTQAIGKMQGYTPLKTFILGRSWSFTEKGIKHHNSFCFDKLGVIDFGKVDKDYLELTAKAIQWVKDVAQNGDSWTVACRPELYPNMCIDGDFRMEKKRIAYEIGDITMLWNCGVKHRANALANGITSWRDERCTAKTLGVASSYAPIVNAILSVNRDHRPIMLPAHILTNVHEWRQVCDDMFVDFETISDIVGSFSGLFMIGVYSRRSAESEEPGWEYTNFTANQATHEEEFRIMNDFVQFIRKRSNGHQKLWYWFAENNFWRTAENRQFDLAGQNIERQGTITAWNLNWVDLRDIFVSEPIVIKDCFAFGLKAIAGAMKKHGMITAELDSECQDGMTAMINAWNVYESGTDVKASVVMQDIIKYNRFDVVSLWDILRHLRTC